MTVLDFLLTIVVTWTVATALGVGFIFLIERLARRVDL